MAIKIHVHNVALPFNGLNLLEVRFVSEVRHQLSRTKTHKQTSFGSAPQ
ncbi:uncharacterized protein G2W53_021009 [Senna tora]|uniref:Uncharacterized protein n=1 Tax=Senna tora TaxID=362788 RepID=A0A834TL64_9FABA|nr:uncharacterized protein G2W53_021009 [Senna tora]